MTINIPAKVNVPELFYGRFVEQLPQSTSLLQRLAATTPQARGRGLTRVLEGVSLEEWDELYSLAAIGRAEMQGGDRHTTLRPAICARALAARMEAIGVTTLVNYTPKRIVVRKPKPAPVVQPEVDNTDLSNVLPPEPPTVDQVDTTPEASPEDLATIQNDIAAG